MEMYLEIIEVHSLQLWKPKSPLQFQIYSPSKTNLVVLVVQKRDTKIPKFEGKMNYLLLHI